MPVRKIYIIAGEVSGDLAAANIMQELQKKYQTEVEFYGVGGSAMEGCGLKSLFPMNQLSLMGLVEIVPQYKKLRKLLHRTIEDIKIQKPDMLITVDVPDFSLRVAKQVGDLVGKKIHLVAPTVWVWRKGRAKKFARIYDRILCYFPFEPNYFNPPAIFIGHPLWDKNQKKEKARATAHAIAHNTKPNPTPNKILLLPGSRKSEVRRLLPIFLQAINLLKQKKPDLQISLLTLPHLRKMVQNYIDEAEENIKVSDNSADKESMMESCDIALAASGTVALELAKAKVPFIVAYKMHLLTSFVLRLLVRVKYACLPNIIADEEIIAEYLQGDCTPQKLADGLLSLFEGGQATQQKVAKAYEAVTQLRSPSKENPSHFAAYVLYDILEKEQIYD